MRQVSQGREHPTAAALDALQRKGLFSTWIVNFVHKASLLDLVLIRLIQYFGLKKRQLWISDPYAAIARREYRNPFRSP
jgi:hypothetical protein